MNGAHVPLFSTGLLSHPGADLVPPLSLAEPVWEVDSGHEAIFESEAFGDGSGFFPRSAYTRRCGWCIAGGVRLNTVREATFAVRVYAPLTVVLQGVPLAETYALLFFLRYVVPSSKGEVTRR